MRMSLFFFTFLYLIKSETVRKNEPYKYVGESRMHILLYKDKCLIANENSNVEFGDCASKSVLHLNFMSGFEGYLRDSETRLCLMVNETKLNLRRHGCSSFKSYKNQIFYANSGKTYTFHFGTGEEILMSIFNPNLLKVEFERFFEIKIPEIRRLRLFDTKTEVDFYKEDVQQSGDLKFYLEDPTDSSLTVHSEFTGSTISFASTFLKSKILFGYFKTNDGSLTSTNFVMRLKPSTACPPPLIIVKGFCEVCYADMYYHVIKQSCVACDEERQHISPKGICLECNASQYPNDDFTECLSCPVGEIYDLALSACVACDDGFIATENGCQKCQPKTLPILRDGKISCLSCLPNEIYDASAKNCKKCSAGKEPNDALNLCVECTNGISKDGGPCVACTGGSTPNSLKTECVCDPSKVRIVNKDGSIACRDCKSNEILNNGTCIKCDAGKEPNDALNLCVECVNSISKDGGPCVACTGGATPNSLKTECVCGPGQEAKVIGNAITCKDCEYNQILDKDGKCQNCLFPNVGNQDKSECVRCGEGLLPSDIAKSCVECPKDTVLNSNGTDCVKCDPGSAPGAAGCKQCGENEISADGKKCSKCPDNQLPNKEKTMCLACSPGQGIKGDKCAPCSDGEISNDQSQCIKCGKNQIPNESKDLCVCVPGKGFNKDKSDCILCPDIIVGTSCKECPENTIANKNKTECICDKYSFIEKNKCVRCKKGYLPSKDLKECVSFSFHISWWIYLVTVLICLVIYIIMLLLAYFIEMPKKMDRKTNELSAYLIDKDQEVSIDEANMYIESSA